MLNNARARAAVASVVNPPARGLLRLGVTPDAVTITGTVLTVGVAIALIPQGNFVIAFFVMFVLSLSDLLDGTMARMSGSSGPWGNFLDATLDRIADGAVFGSFAVYGALTSNMWITVGAIAALVTGQVTSYAKARAEAVGATANVGIAERAERLLLVGFAMLLTGFGVPYVLAGALWLIFVLGVITIVQRIRTVRAQLRGATGE